jgi:hypothetical protein
MKKIIKKAGITLGFVLVTYSQSTAQFYSLPLPYLDIVIYSAYADSTTNRLYIGGFWNELNPIPGRGFLYYDFNTQLLDTISDRSLHYGAYCQRIRKIDSLIYMMGATSFLDTITGMSYFHGLVATDGNKWIKQPGAFTNLTSEAEGYDIIKTNDTLIIGGRWKEVNNNINNTGLVLGYSNNSWINYGLTGGTAVGSLCSYKGELYAGGNFDNTAGTISDLARFNGTNWQIMGNGINGGFSYIKDMIEYNGLLFVAGYFDAASNNPGNSVAAWDGTQWIPIPGVSGLVRCFAIYGGELYIGGSFMPGGGFAKWDGVSWIPLAQGYPAPDGITAMTPYNNSLYIVGGFDTLNNQALNHIAEYRTTVGIAENEQKEQLFAFPNPINSSCTIFCPLSWKENEVLIQLVDISGRHIMNKTISMLESRVTLETEDIQPGVYQVRLSTKTHSNKTRLIISH